MSPERSLTTNVLPSRISTRSSLCGSGIFRLHPDRMMGASRACGYLHWSAVPRQGEIMAVGPVDVYIIGFPGNKFSGRIAPAIMELVENGTIRILDLLFVSKDADGVVTTLAAEDVGEDGAAYVEIDVSSPGALGEEDAEEVGDDLPDNSSALLIAYENVWVAKVVDAMRDADAVLIDS